MNSSAHKLIAQNDFNGRFRQAPNYGTRWLVATTRPSKNTRKKSSENRMLLVSDEAWSSGRDDSWTTSWVGTLFDYQPPRFGFSRSEQRLLHAALAGESGTDNELSESLGVSLPTIKKMWLSIYRRVNDRQPKRFA